MGENLRQALTVSHCSLC